VSAAQGRLPIGHVVAGRFQVAALLGAGEMGEVYDARDTGTGYAYALKLFRPDVLRGDGTWDSFERDARRASAIGGEAVAKVFEFGIDQQAGAPYMLSEFLVLPTLQQLVATQGPLSFLALEAVLRAVAPGLDKAHAHGVFHRALKPQNMFVGQNEGNAWQVKVTDFGVSSLRLVAPPPPGWTATPGWLSAEQADPSTKPTATMDIYALGLVAFYALTGRSPFRACQDAAVDLNQLWSEMTAPLPPLSIRAREIGVTLSPTLDPWFSRVLAVSPAQRFKTASDMAQALFALVGSSHHVATMRPPAAPGQGPQQGAPRMPQRTILLGAQPAPPADAPAQVPRPGPSPFHQPPPPPMQPGLEDEDEDDLPTRAMSRGEYEASVASAGQSAAAGAQEPAAAGSPGRAASAGSDTATVAGLGPLAQPAMEPVQMFAGLAPRPAAAYEQAAPAPPLDPLLQGGPADPAAGAHAGGPVHAVARAAAANAPTLVLEDRKKPNMALAIGLAAAALFVLVGFASCGACLLLRGRGEQVAVAGPRASGAAASTSGRAAGAATGASAASASPAGSVAAAGPGATETAAAPPAKPTDGLVKLACNPDCDEVKCDGKVVEQPGEGVRLEAGKHACTGSKKGYVSKTERFEVKAGDEQSKTLKLAKVPEGPPAGGPPPPRNCGTFINPCK
jgi:serine/threonine-protein kinase